MRIGIDIDNTLVSSNEYFEYIKKREKLNFKKNYTDGWTEDECKEILSKYGFEVIKNAKLKDKAIEVLNYLQSRGHKLFIITARNNKYVKNSVKLTKNYLKSYGLKLEGCYFDRANKSDIAKSLNIDLMIDDSKSVYREMKKNNIDCILFGDKIKTWEQVLDYVESRCANGKNSK